MTGLILGVVAFAAMATSDGMKLTGRPRAGFVFYCGCGLLIFATGLLIAEQGGGRCAAQPWRFLLLPVAGLALALLVYTVCFAVSVAAPEENGLLPLVDQGMYALCRHPGVIWLSVFYLALLGLLGGGGLLTAWILFTGLDLLYVLWQDRDVFPKTIRDYAEYRKRTPFLIPNADSLRLCAQQLRSRLFSGKKPWKG